MKCDVVFLTKNSNRPVLHDCLRALYANVNVNRLLVIDEGSKDDTLAVVSAYPDVEIHQTKGGRAVARQRGIDIVETEWHMHLDSDIVLCDDWQVKAEKLIADDVGAIWGCDIPANPRILHRVIPMQFVRRLDVPGLMIRNAMMWNRGNTNDTLIRTEVVKDIRIPSDLHVFEDWFIRKHIEDKGYRFVLAREPFCLHYSEPSFSYESCAQIASLQKKYGRQSFLTTAKYFLLGPAKCAAILMLTRDREAARDQWHYYWRVFKARLKLEVDELLESNLR